MIQGPSVKKKKKLINKVKKLRKKYDHLVEDVIPDVKLQIEELKWDLEVKEENVKNSEDSEIRNQKKVAQEIREMNRLLLAVGIRCLKKDMMLKVSRCAML